MAADYAGDDRFRLAQAAALADAARLPLMAVNNVLYHAPDRRPLQDVLTAIRLKKTVVDCGFALCRNAERHLKPPQEMKRLFRRYPEALAETVRFSRELTFSLGELQYNYPDEPTESGLLPGRTRAPDMGGAKTRFPSGLSEKHRRTIRHELETVSELKYALYFLTVYDIVKFARSQGILCQGRGSAANSLICYCIGITDVGPDVVDVLFERFISKERNEPPDIDVDFEHERREDVIAYIYRKYSSRRTALACSVISYRGRSAMREVGKAMGLSDDAQTAMSGSIWGWSTSELGAKEAAAAGLDDTDPTTRLVFQRANEIVGFPATFPSMSAAS